jgi:predicted metal-binding membrane protein
MAHAQALAAVGLIRKSRRRGFCPACRLFRTGDDPHEIAAPALVALAFLVVAGGAWVSTVARIGAMDDMAMGLGSIEMFVASWAMMMLAMMVPSAIPLVFAFAQNAERRRGWVAATALLVATYLGMWLLFGVVCYVLYNALGMPWPNQGVIGGAALVVAGVYALTPIKRMSEGWCRELCALHSPLPFNLMRSAVVAGVRYAVSCLGCSAGLMVAMVLIGMSNLVWMIVLAALVLAYKIGPAPTRGLTFALSGALVVMGIAYAATTA